MKPVKVIFVCMGNICRSPTAHGVFQALVDKHDLGAVIQVESAGTHSYHIGNPPDARSQATARQSGVDLSGLTARRFVSADFTEFDYLLGMDNSNIADMHAIRPAIRPADAPARLQLMLEYSQKFAETEVPDPYFGEGGFELVFDMIDDASRGLLRHIRSEHQV